MNGWNKNEEKRTKERLDKDIPRIFACLMKSRVVFKPCIEHHHAPPS